MRWLATHSWKIAVIVMVVSASVTVGIAIHAGPRLVYQDERDYVALSKHLVQLHRFTLDGVEPTASRPPGYIWFLAVPQMFGASNTALRVFNVTAMVFSQLFLFLLARRISSEATAVIAVLLSLGYPVLFYSATVLFPQTLGAALLLCGLWLLFDKPLTITRAVAAGTAWAALILTIPTFLIPTAALSIWLFWQRRDFRRMAIPFAAPVIIMLGAWSARNYIAFRAPVFIATNGGVNLLLGNSENVTPDSGSSADISRYTKIGHQLSEPERNRYYTESAKMWVKEHPAQAARLYKAKLLRYFSFADRTEANDRSTPLSDEGQSWREIIMILSYGPLLLLFLARLAFSAKYPLSQEEICLVGLYLANALFAAVFFTRIRFRLPMDWLMIVIDAGMIFSIVSRLSSTDWLAWRNRKRMKRLAEAESAALQSARMRLSAMHILEQQ
jgi:4-amino-4-deoxy-L-arabinose transferase-like glycosyltransferase